jgi:predicted RNase H-like HicB family nuclease
MILEYCEKAIEKAEYKKLEDGTWFAEIPDFQGFGQIATRLKNAGKS